MTGLKKMESTLPNSDALREYDRVKQTEDEVRLWRAVIYQAISDVGSRNEVVRDQARHWLLHDTDDYYVVCELAMMPPVTLRNELKEIINE